MRPLILASQSPRRKELLTMLGYEFTALPADVDEDGVEAATPVALVEKLALIKARHIFASQPQGVIIGSDTIVVHNGGVLGKPKDEAHAVAMLTALSGKVHHVLTGLAIVSAEKERSFVVETAVRFKALTELEIRRYVQTGEPMDKAGAYGVQGMGAFLVEEIHGDYYTVMGLPVCTLVKALETEFGISMFS